MSIIAGIGWHMVGAASAASFYAPIEKVKKWSWETTWAVAGIFSWILLPIGVSFLLLPHYRRVLCLNPIGGAVEGRALRSHVGRRQRELRPHHAPPGHVARHRRGHRRHTGRGHPGAAAHAWPGRDPLPDPRWPAQPWPACWWPSSAWLSSPMPGTRKRSSSRPASPPNSTYGWGWRWRSCAASSRPECPSPSMRPRPSSRRR